MRAGGPGYFPPRYPTALERLTSPESFAFGDYPSLMTRHVRQIVGSDLPEATPIDADAVTDHWVDFYVDRILDKMDTVTIVDGEPGLGKSNFTLWLASKIRDRLGRETHTTRTLDLRRDIVYRLTTFVHRVYESSRENPSVVIADEGVLIGAQGTSGLSDIGVILDRVLSVGRIQGCTIFVLHPNIRGLASFVRNRRARVFLHVERRGLTTAFLLKTRIDFKGGTNELPFGKAPQPWAKILWPSLETDPIWAPYEADKLETVKQTLVDSEIRASEIEKKAGLRAKGPLAVATPRSGRAPGETPEEYHRRMSRQRMRDRRAETRREAIEGRGRTRARVRAED